MSDQINSPLVGVMVGVGQPNALAVHDDPVSAENLTGAIFLFSKDPFFRPVIRVT